MRSYEPGALGDPLMLRTAVGSQVRALAVSSIVAVGVTADVGTVGERGDVARGDVAAIFVARYEDNDLEDGSAAKLPVTAVHRSLRISVLRSLWREFSVQGTWSGAQRTLLDS